MSVLVAQVWAHWGTILKAWACTTRRLATVVELELTTSSRKRWSHGNNDTRLLALSNTNIDY